MKSQYHNTAPWRSRTPAALALLAGFAASSAYAVKPFTYAENVGPSTLNPVFADDMYATRAAEYIFDGLLGTDKLGSPVAMLADSWKVAEDKQSVTLTLRKNALWHDGKPFGADDVVFTVTAMQHPKTASTNKSEIGFIARVEKVDDHAVKLVYRQPLPDPLKVLRFKILPKHKFTRPYLERSDSFGLNPVGTGPYKFVKRNAQNWLYFEKFDKYYRPAGIREITLQEVPSKQTQVELMQYQSLDVIVRVLPKDLPVFAKLDSIIDIEPYQTLNWWYLGFNMNKKLFQNQDLRIALDHALNREELREANLGDGATISGPFAPDSPFYNHNVHPREHSQAKVAQYMTKAGFVKNKAGIWASKNMTAAFTLTVQKSYESYKNVVLSIQTGLRNAGFDVKVEWLDDAAWPVKVERQRSYDVVLSAWNFDENSNIDPLFHSAGEKNFTNYKNTEVDKYIEKAQATTDPEIYKKLYHELHKQLHEDLPYVFLWSLQGHTAYALRIENFSVHPFYYFSYINEWSLRE